MFESRKVGDRIGGIYEVQEVLGGAGWPGMSEDYLCFYRWHRASYVLKTYQQRLGIFRAFREAFHDAAKRWVRLGAHPHIVRAFWAHRLDGRTYIITEHIPQDESGRRTLADHLLPEIPLPLDMSLLWGIQFCRGMEYANALGTRVHGGIRPESIMITPEGGLKINGIGLASALCADTVARTAVPGASPWMAPEPSGNTGGYTPQSDIYSFGVVLHQMALGRLPPSADASTLLPARDTFRRLHGAVSEPALDSPLHPAIRKCLRARAQERYRDFAELRVDLESLWREHIGKPVPAAPAAQQLTTARELNQQGVAMKHLGLPAEALSYHDRAIELEATYPNAWNDRGVALRELGRDPEALECFEEAIRLDPAFVHPMCNKGHLLLERGHCEDALLCFELATDMDDEFPNAWHGKGQCLLRLGQWLDAAECFERVLQVNDHDCHAWLGKGTALMGLARITARENDYLAEASACVEKALDLDPFFPGAYGLLTEIRRLARNDAANN